MRGTTDEAEDLERERVLEMRLRGFIHPDCRSKDGNRSGSERVGLGN